MKVKIKSVKDRKVGKEIMISLMAGYYFSITAILAYFFFYVKPYIGVESFIK